MSIDTRGSGFIRVTDIARERVINIRAEAIEAFIAKDGHTNIFSPTIQHQWGVKESEQEIYDKIREARAEPVQYAAINGPKIGVVDTSLLEAEESDQPVIDWRWVPKKWNAFAIDSDGRGVYYRSRPEMMSDEWAGVDVFCETAGFYNPAGWERSLQQRPEGV